MEDFIYCAICPWVQQRLKTNLMLQIKGNLSPC